MWKNKVEPDRSQTMRTRIACWMIKATNIHSAYVILIAFPPPQWLHEHTSMLLYTFSRSYIGRHAKCTLFLAGFNETRNFSTDFRKILKNKISWKSIWWEPSCSMQTDRQADMMKLIVAFCNFANAPANSSLCTHSLFLCRSLYAYIRTADGDPRVAKWQLTDRDKLLVYFFHRLVQVPHLLTTGTTSLLTP